MSDLRRWPVDRAGVIVVRDGQLALIRRERDGLRYFVIPGGGIESNETPEEAARREGREELGVDLLLGPLRVRIDHRTRGVIQRQWYFQATTDVDAIAVTGPELTHGAERGTYTAVWLPLDDLDPARVYPEAVARLLVKHLGHWPEGVIEIDET